MSNKSIDLSTDKIRYLAIGDSITEGFNSRYGIGFPGKIYFDKDNNINKISGMSYPSILAQMLENINPGCIETFDNFALTGTRVVDWLYFLGIDPKKYNYSNSEKQILESKEYDIRENNPQKRRAYSQFGMFGVNNNNDFNKLKNKIKKANLITLTIGANDWLTDFPFFEIMSLKKNILSKEQFDKKIDKINDDLFAKIKKFFNAIKEINPTANIIAISYPTSLPFLARLNNEELNKNSDNKIVIGDYIELLNDVIMKVTDKTNTYYINCENKAYWEENVDDLSKIFFDIHPTYFGYKKIAHEIFSKLALSNDFYDESFDKIKNIFPNTNKEYFESDYKKFSNVIDFSKINLSNEALIKLSNVTNEKLFWSDNSHEKEFLNLRRELSIKKYFSTNIKSSSYNNIRKLLNTLLFFIEENNFDPNNYLQKILENKEYSSLLWKIIYRSDYLDIVVNQIQDKIDNNSKLKIKTNLQDFKGIIFNRLFDISNIFLLLKDFSIEISKLDDKKFSSLIENAAISILINVNHSEKYNEPIKIFIKNKAVDIVLKRFKSTETDLINALIDNFLDNNLELIFINLIKTYFGSLDNIADLKNINTFINKFVTNFFKKIDIKLIMENIIGNDQLEYIFSEIIINILEIKNYTVHDVLLFKKFIKLLILKINNNDFIISIFSKLVLFFININNNKTKSSSLDFIWSFKGHEFWNILKHSKIKKMWTNENDVFVVADLINLIFEKSSTVNSEFYKILINIKHPKLRENSFTSNLFNIAKDWIEKIYKIENVYLLIANTLYNSFLEFKKINPNIKNEENPYYKAYYRFVVSSLWIGYRLFQKDIPINIFWNTKKGILKSLPSISNQIHRLAMGNTKNKDRAALVNYIFGAAYIQHISDLTVEEDALLDSVLWYIQTSESINEFDYVKKQKKMFIIKSLQNGYWGKN